MAPTRHARARSSHPGPHTTIASRVLVLVLRFRRNAGTAAHSLLFRLPPPPLTLAPPPRTGQCNADACEGGVGRQRRGPRESSGMLVWGVGFFFGGLGLARWKRHAHPHTAHSSIECARHLINSFAPRATIHPFIPSIPLHWTALRLHSISSPLLSSSHLLPSPLASLYHHLLKRSAATRKRRGTPIRASNASSSAVYKTDPHCWLHPSIHLSVSLPPLFRSIARSASSTSVCS